MDNQPLARIGFVIALFCATGALLTSKYLDLGPSSHLWILGGVVLVLLGQVFVDAETGHSADGRGEIIVIVAASAGLPFLLGFLTTLSVDAAGPQVNYQVVAIIFALSLLWPMYAVVRVARGLRFRHPSDDTQVQADLDHLTALLERLDRVESLNRTQKQVVRTLVGRLAGATRLEASVRVRTLAATLDALKAFETEVEFVKNDRVMLAYGRRKNIGVVDQLVAGSSFISVIVTVGQLSAVPYAVTISQVQILAFVVDLRWLVLAGLVVCLGAVAFVHVLKTPRPVAPRAVPLTFRSPKASSLNGILARFVFGLRVAAVNAANSILHLLTELLNFVVFVVYTLGVLWGRVFKHMGHVARESITKAGTWKLIVYLCVTFLLFSGLGALLAVLGRSVVAAVTFEGSPWAVGLSGLAMYLAPIGLLFGATFVLIAASFLLNLLFDRERDWAETQLNDLLLAVVPVAVGFPIAGFVLWVVERVFPSTQLVGFHSIGLTTIAGGAVVIIYGVAAAIRSRFGQA